MMARKRYTTEQIIGLLREAEVRLGQRQAMGTICRGIAISEQTSLEPLASRKSTSVAANLDDLRLTLCDKQWSAANGDPIDFSRASLRRADFRFATLEAAELRGADLRDG